MIKNEERHGHVDNVVFESQKNFFEVIFPELSHTSSYITLNNANQFDELLTYLENNLSSISLNSNYKEIECIISVPSVNIFRILLTLASRHPKINYSVHSTISGDSFFANDKHEDYSNCMYKPTFRERSINILRIYLNILIKSGYKNSGSLSHLHKNMMQMILDIVEKSRNKSKISTKTNKKILSKPKNHDIKNPNVLRVNDIGNEVVSDSDEDVFVLRLVENTNKMEQEVKKYQIYNSHSVKTNQMHSLSDLKNDKYSRLTPEHSVKSSRSSSPSINDRIPQNTLQTIKIFGDNITGYNLNKNLNSTYSFWEFLTWTFYCAKSSMEEEHYKLSHYSSIFQIYLDLSNIIIDLITYNFHSEINSCSETGFRIEIIDTFKSLEFHKHALHKLFKDSNNKNVLTGILRQLDCPLYDLCDFAVNTLFIGLSNERLSTPIPLFERDFTIINSGLSDDLVSIGKQGNYLTIGIRAKLLQVLYLRTILCEIGNTSNEDFNSERLVSQIAFNLLQIDVSYIKEFFVVLVNDISVMSRVFRENMILEICKSLISQLVNPIKRDSLNLLKDISSKSVEKMLKYIIKMIKDKNMYLSIIEDETFSSITDFEQTWYKLNFSIEWIFILSLKKFEKVPLKNSQLEHLLLQSTKADKIRKKFYKNFILEHYETKETKSFNLTVSQYKEMQKKQEWVDFSELLEMRFFIK